MRLLFLLDNFNQDDRHGVILLRLCQRLAPIRELTLSVIALGEDGPLNERFNSIGVHARALKLTGWKDRKKIKSAGEKVLFRADRPDIVHSMGRWPDLKARLFVSSRNDIPLLTSVLDMAFCSDPPMRDTMMWRMAERLTRRYVTKVIVCSQCQRKELINRGVPEDLIHSISLGIDGVLSYPLSENNKEQFRELIGLEADAPLIACGQRLRKGHGLETLLHAMVKVIKKDVTVKLFLVGDGPLRPELESQINQLGLHHNVHIIGHLSSQLPKLYSTADVVVYTATHEAFSIPVTEAQAAGTPVVAAESGTNSELVIDKETGILYPPGDSKTLANHLILLLHDDELRSGMGVLAREHVLEHFELSQTADNYVELWRLTAPHALWETTTSLHFEDLQDMKREALEK